jgi:hypothetical protein
MAHSINERLMELLHDLESGDGPVVVLALKVADIDVAMHVFGTSAANSLQRICPRQYNRVQDHSGEPLGNMITDRFLARRDPSQSLVIARRLKRKQMEMIPHALRSILAESWREELEALTKDEDAGE